MLKQLVYLIGSCLLIIVLSVLQAGAQEGNDGTAAATSVGDPPTAATSTPPVQPTPAPAVVGDVSPRAYLPLVVKPETCPFSPEAATIADLAMSHPEQGRPFMQCHPILAQVAYERALDMGTRNYFGHTNPDGYGPNYLVEQAGYNLPDWYGQAPDANNIESIAAGYTTAADAWNAWLSSSGHRAHVLAEDDFWADQTNFGVGYAYVANSTYRHYWVFISAPPE